MTGDGRLRTLIKDPLLTAARLIVNGVIFLLAVAALALVVGAGYLAMDPAPLQVELVNQGLAHPGPAVVRAILAIMLLALVPLAMAVAFLLALRQVIDSVGLGDPFAPANAGRLARMGWLVLAMQVAAFPIGAIAMWLARQVKDVNADIGISGGGVVLALTLFILARVFRHGAAMREELEGTV